MASGKCLLPSCHEYGPLQTIKVNGVNTIILRSKERGDDDIYLKLQTIIESQGTTASVECHKTCYCAYKSNVAKFLSKKRKDKFSTLECEPSPSRVRRSQLPTFQFKKHCLICGEECIPKDAKNPGRWDRVIKCETSDRPGHSQFKDVLLDVCEHRNDELGRMVEVRIKGALTDLPAADAQYHKKCYDTFMVIPKYTNLSHNHEIIDDDALKLLIDDMFTKQHLRTWTTIELYDMYRELGGQLSSKQMFTQLTTYLGDDIVVVRIEGCASIVGFRHLISKSLKMSKVDSVDEESIDAVIRQVRSEARVVQNNNADYDLGEFTRSNTLKQTSITLLTLISKLVSNGNVTQQSLSLAQSIQGHVTGTRNQTTLGLAVKLHHRHGSSEMIKLLHDYGFIVSYDEVLRFRKSAAKFVGDNSSLLHQSMGLLRGVGPVFGWFDNLDLLISTPNGRRETHVMAHEFQQHPAGIIESGAAQPGVMNLVIPRLRKSAAASFSISSSRSIPLQHYTGPKKVKPPAVPTTVSVSYTDACARDKSLAAAQDKDMQWLNSLSSDQSIEWHGFNNQLAREQAPPTSIPATVYLFGPLIDAPPSHPDTVLTSLLYMQKSLGELGMAYANMSIDMQLYMVACNAGQTNGTVVEGYQGLCTKATGGT